jgi:ATP-binding cassette, subfamily B, multidrug efflux pump
LQIKQLLTLAKYFKKHRLPIIGSILHIIATNAAAIALPWILKLVIDSIKDYPQSKPQLIVYAALIVGLAAVEGIFRFYMRRLLIGVSRKIEYSIRADFFIHLQRLDPSFFENNRTGSIMALISNDLDAVRNFLGPGLLNLFSTVFAFASTLTVMFFISVKLTLYSLIAIPLLPLIVSRLSAMLHSRFKLSQEHYALLSARTQESISGIKVVKSFTQEDNEISTFAELNREYINKNMALARVRSLFWPLMILVGGIGSLVVLIIGGFQVINGRLTIGQFVQFSAYIIALAWPLMSLGWVINLIQRGEVSMGRLNKVFNMAPGIKEPEKPARINKLSGNIVFRDVYFKYPKLKSYELYEDAPDGKKEKNSAANNRNSETINPSSNGSIIGEAESIANNSKTIDGAGNITGENIADNPDSIGDGSYTQGNYTSDHSSNWTIKKISFEIKPGTQTGIAGFTGSGKSTIVNLIPRLYDIQEGSVMFDGVDIRQMPLKILRSGIAYVTQDPFIFSSTIRENILFGKEEKTGRLPKEELDKKIIEASKIAHLHEDIETFPDKYHTVVGERGITLSGGQKQRLAIARALFYEPEILIMDDSFSNIDTNTEEMILRDLKIRTKNLTTIIISHRISTIKDSDFILIMDEGEIAERGNHSQLLKKCGIYQKLYKRQQLAEELDEEL